MSATAEAPATPAAAESASAPAAGGKGKMKLVAIIAAVMAVEGAVMFFLIPRGTAAPAAHNEEAEHGEAGGHGGHGDTHGDDHNDDEPQSETAEVAIDSFMCTNNRASPGSIMHISFKIFAIVPTAQKESFEKHANSESKARVRQAIVKVARSSNMEELGDPELSTIKRLIREEINKVLKKSYVLEVVVSDFKTIEQ